MTVLIRRTRELQTLSALITRHPVVAIIGARQVGKTTLARELSKERSATYFDLEDPADLARLDDPVLALKDLSDLVVIDEIQRRPDLFPVLRVLVDRPDNSARFLVLGSASPDLLRQSSESLAGRIAYHELNGFTLDEVGTNNMNRLWHRGGFPRAYLAAGERASHEWRREFIRTFLERDLPQLGSFVPAATLHRFWSMIAHYHGQIWNASEFARSFGIPGTSVRRYLDLLTSVLVLRQLLPWHENIRKRQVKAPKIYIADSGILHTLLGLGGSTDLERHPKVGASWEGFILQAIMRQLQARREECSFWATYSGAELDLLVIRGTRRLGFEVKRTTAPSITRSMRAAIDTLRLDTLDIIHAGEHTFPLADRVRAVSAQHIERDLTPLE